MAYKYTVSRSIGFFAVLLFFAVILSASSGNMTNNSEKVVAIHTTYGTMKVRLYDATPKHRDNFLKLVREHYYDSLLFHRVIHHFMIQGGDPDSRNADPGQVLGDGGPGYTVPAEFVDTLFHKKGVLAAARESDDVNPEMASSGSQFYLVQGKVFSIDDLMLLEKKRIKKYWSYEMQQLLKDPAYAKHAGLITAALKTGNREVAEREMAALKDVMADRMTKYRYTPEQIRAYTTIGGTPHLDDRYTVFGEIIEGMDVLDKIAAVKTGKFDRPVDDVRMWMEVVN